MRQETGAELLLVCDPDSCGPTARLGFDAVPNANLKGAKLADFLAQSNSSEVVRSLKAFPGVTKVVVLKEGRTKLGATEAYQVVSELTLQDGGKRVRHTFMTLNDGHVYYLFLGCPAEAYDRALANAQPVLNSFAFK
jgi:hypothetical protein